MKSASHAHAFARPPMNSSACIRSACASIAFLSICGVVHAANSFADFGDVASGSIIAKTGGVGWTGSWSGSGSGFVVANNLTSSLYAAPQSGAARHFQNTNATGLRLNYRVPTFAFAGTIWFSFLMMAEEIGDRAGLALNAPTEIPFGNPGAAYTYLNGTTLNFSFGAGTAGSVEFAVPTGQTALIVGRINLNGGAGGEDPTSVWLNPNLIANPDINSFTPFYTNASVDWLGQITSVGAIAARADDAAVGAGNLDNIRISDGSGNANLAYAQVTGVPETSTTALLGISALAFALRRREQRASL